MGVVAVATPQLTALADAIKRQEGYIPPNSQYPNGSLAYQNNNPGNLVYVGQAGAIPGAGGFAAFSSYDAGYQALMNQLQLDANHGLTVQQEAAKWCPASVAGCNVPQYANTMASALGVDPTTALADAFNGAAADSIPADPFSTSTDSGLIAGMDPATLAVIAAGLAAIAYFA